jgi:hypothetical protein
VGGMMKTEFKLPKPVETYVRATNWWDAKGFRSCFAADAVVKDIGREMRGLDAILEWAKNEIFAVNVTLEVLEAVEQAGHVVLTVKVEGTFDRTGLPDPLVMEHRFTLVGGKIATLECQLAAT